MKTGNRIKKFTVLHTGLLWFALVTIPFADGELFAVRAPLLAPVLDNIESNDLFYTKGAGKVNITKTLTVSDFDSKVLRSATIRISIGYNFFEDVLSYKDADGISGYWNIFTGVLTLRGRASAAEYESALRRIQYENTNINSPSNATRTVSFTVSDGYEISNLVSRDIVISAANMAPVLTSIETAAVVYCVNSGSATITASIGVNDPDSPLLTSAIIRIGNGYALNEDFLRFADQNGISGSWNSSTGTLSLSGEATVTNYQGALRSIKFENTNNIDPVTGNREISFTVNDGTNPSNTLYRTFLVNGRVSAMLTGSTSICSDDRTTTPLQVDLTGNSPWTFVITRNNENEVLYKNITDNPYFINVKQDGVYQLTSIQDANCTGDTIGSGYARITYEPSPTAIISGIDSICPGGEARLQVTLTGKAPWRFTYLRNGANPSEVDDITSDIYTLKVTGTGTYTLLSVEDALCKGKVSGSGIVRQYNLPTAHISGDATICENTSAGLSVTLTGTPPWGFSYRLGAETPVNVQNVLTSPKIVPGNKAGTYTLVEVYDKNCKGTVSGSATIGLLPAPEVSITGLSPAYDKKSPLWIPVQGHPAGGTFSGSGMIEYNNEWFFVPSLPPAGTHNIVYIYAESVGTCYGFDTVVVRVLEASAIIEFENDRTNFCTNDQPFEIEGINLSGVIGSFTIEGGLGLVDHHDNTATVYPSLLNIDQFTITFSYYDGAALSVSSDFYIGKEPKADFKWESECYHAGQSILLKNTSESVYGNLTDTSYRWKIYTSTGFEEYTSRDVEHIFPHAGNHTVEMHITNSYGCKSTAKKVLGLSPIISLASKTYIENFETLPSLWHSGTSSNVNNWELGQPSKHDSPLRGFTGKAPGVNCWYTDLPMENPPMENSWVTSPCFDFTAMQKPMVKVDIWRLFNGLRDGATFQASADSGKTWMVIGQLNDGVNWFNEYQINGNPGNQKVGWSNIKDAGWVESRHSLDVLIGKPEVQFRIAYGSDGTAIDNDGIAFDNFWIVERNRMSLIEHFTNSSDGKSAKADSILNNFVNDNQLNVIDLQYHTSNPSNDLFYEDNPIIPTAREFYYGIPGVPYSLLNGGTSADFRYEYKLLKTPDTSVPLVESLRDSKFEIRISSQVRENTLFTDVQVTPFMDMPAEELSLRIAVIEQVISDVTGNNGDTTFESVVKAMLPDAAGTTIYRSWNLGESVSVKESWNLQNVHKSTELRVVAFIQNESTQEVYQAEMDTIGVYTGIENLSLGSEYEKFFVLYPNPAQGSAFIKFSEETMDNLSIELYNNLGGLVYTKRVPAGTKIVEMQMQGYPDGLYLIRLLNGDRLLGSSKLTLSK